MVASNNFIAKDYLRAFDLKNLFHKYVVFYSQLHYPDSQEPLSSKDRHDLNFKLQETMNEMSVLVLRMKEAKPDTEIPENANSTLAPKLNKAHEYRAAN